MRSKHRKTLGAIFTEPTLANIKWNDVESLFRACDAHVEQRGGSRVGIHLGDRIANLHRPHPSKEINKSTVESIRRFLKEVGITP